MSAAPNVLFSLLGCLIVSLSYKAGIFLGGVLPAVAKV
jgi:hypothetical protein